jgi:hypothetical protein
MAFSREVGKISKYYVPSFLFVKIKKGRKDKKITTRLVGCLIHCLFWRKMFFTYSQSVEFELTIHC